MVLGCRGGGVEGASQLELSRELAAGRRRRRSLRYYCGRCLATFIRHYVVDLNIPVVLRLYRRLALWILSFLLSLPA